MSLHRMTAIAGWALVCGPLMAAPADDPYEYRIQPGDTFIGITGRMLRPGTSWLELQRANPRLRPRQLPPGGTLRIPARLLLQTAELAEVLHAHGTVTVEHPGGAAPVPLAGGERLSRGDRLRTGAQSSTALRFADGARVLLRPQSELVIDSTVRIGRGGVVHTELGLPSGSADSQVPPREGRADGATRYRIRTPVANLGVRGTEFRTTADAQHTQLEVLDGTVALGAVQSPGRPVPAGFGSIASAQSSGAPQALLGAPDLSAAPARVERLPLAFGWAAMEGAAGYRAQVFDAGPGELLRLDGVFTQPLARWADDLPDGEYELRVRAAAASGLEGRDGRARFTLKARPEPPLVTDPPADARTGDAAIEFAWTRNPSAVGYHLQVADDAGFGAPKVDRDDIAATRVAIELPVGTHHWRLASIRDGQDQGPWGDVQRITRVELPPAPAAEPPQEESGGIRLRWAAGPPGTHYRIQVARDETFAQIVHDENVDRPTWLLPRPEPGRYRVRVKGIDSEGFEGPYGSPQELEVARNLWWLLLLPLVLLL